MCLFSNYETNKQINEKKSILGNKLQKQSRCQTNTGEKICVC